MELLEAIAYLICQDDPVTPESYHRILSSRQEKEAAISKLILIVSVAFFQGRPQEDPPTRGHQPRRRRICRGDDELHHQHYEPQVSV